ncbi:hypothetical protein [Longimicrobium sp.]|uniref:hypothetical protein n=1 Tax=Longimicrobium sp. TaxID=2029185 RepID=UPI003B3B3AA4
MAEQRSIEFEQKLIDHEVRISEAREAGEVFAAGRDARLERSRSQADRRWYRAELIAMLGAARTERELRELGLSDAVVREARLGDSLLAVWAHFRLAHLAIPTGSNAPVTHEHSAGQRP